MESAPWKCPHCGIVNLSSQQRCDCGFDRVEGVVVEDADPPGSKNFHPWRRYLARYVDWMLSGALIMLLSTVIGIAPVEGELGGIIYAIVAVVAWVPLEAMFLSAVGFTPGKFLMRIRVTCAGQKPGLWSAFERATLATIVGGALGLNLVAAFTMFVAYSRLDESGTTYWDNAAGSEVSHARLGPTRKVVTGFAIAGIVLLKMIALWATVNDMRI